MQGSEPWLHLFSKVALVPFVGKDLSGNPQWDFRPCCGLQREMKSLFGTDPPDDKSVFRIFRTAHDRYFHTILNGGAQMPARRTISLLRLRHAVQKGCGAEALKDFAGIPGDRQVQRG